MQDAAKPSANRARQAFRKEFMQRGLYHNPCVRNCDANHCRGQPVDVTRSTDTARQEPYASSTR